MLSTQTAALEPRGKKTYRWEELSLQPPLNVQKNREEKQEKEERNESDNEDSAKTITIKGMRDDGPSCGPLVTPDRRMGPTEEDRDTTTRTACHAIAILVSQSSS